MNTKIPILSVCDKAGNKIPIPAIRGKSAYEYARDGGYTGTEAEFAEKLARETITPGIENAGKLLYVDESGNEAFLQLGDGLEIVNGRLCITGTVTPDEPDTPVEPDEPAEPITFAQTGENSVTVSGVVFEQSDGTVLWRGATFASGDDNTVIIS